MISAMKVRQRNGIYKDLRNRSYLVKDLGVNCETLKKYVIYQRLNKNELLIKEYDDFLRNFS